MTVTTQRQLSIPLPVGIATPKYGLWQRVRHSGYGITETGWIIGMQWVDDTTALMEHITPGWHYILSRVYGIAAVKELVAIDSSHVIVSEGQLEGCDD